MENRDTIIIGAGPSGYKAGQVLADHGKDDVLILEKTGGKNLANKICSGMFPSNNMAIFKIPKDITDTYIDTVRMYFPKDTIEIKFPIPICYMMDRRNGKFGRWLIGETEKIGVEVRSNTEASKIHKEDNVIELKNGEKIKYKNLIIANGSGGEFRKQLGLDTKSVFCTHIEVPYSDINDKRKTVGHSYFDFNMNGIGYSGYTPYENSVGFCQVFCNDKFFTKQEKIKRFNKYVKKIEGVDLNNYKFLAKNVNYMPIDIRQGNNIWICGDSGGNGDIGGGLIYTAAKSGEIAAHDVLGIDIKKEIRDYKKKYDGMMYRIVDKLNNKFIVKNLMENAIPKVLSNKAFLNKLLIKKVYNKLLNKVIPLFTPFPENEWNEFDQQYYSKENLGYDLLKIKNLKK